MALTEVLNGRRHETAVRAVQREFTVFLMEVKNENSPFDGGFRRYRFALALLLLCRAEPIRASHESFQMAGGKGRRLLNPPIEADGHMIYLKPALRRAALKEYLAGIGGVSRGN